MRLELGLPPVRLWHRQRTTIVKLNYTLQALHSVYNSWPHRRRYDGRAHAWFTTVHSCCLTPIRIGTIPLIFGVLDAPENVAVKTLANATDTDQIWWTCTGQRPTTFRKFWFLLVQWGKVGARMMFAQDFVNFLTANFHQIWQRPVNPCPLKWYWKGFQTFSIYGSFAPKNLNIDLTKYLYSVYRETKYSNHCNFR